jgi:phospholipid/cholesterol/gamma-HCH transport system substrate-binding protein
VLAATIDNSSYGATNTYKADFTDATGLQLGDDVRIAGVRVGTVEDIAVRRDARHHSFAQVSFTVQKSTPLPKSTVVNLRYRNLIGQRYLDVEQGPGDPNDPGQRLAPGAEIARDHTNPAVDLTVLFQGFKPLVQALSADQLNKLSMEIVQTLQGEGGALTTLLTDLADLTNTLADKDEVIGDVVDNLSAVLQAVGERDSELTQLIVQLKNFVSGLAADRDTISRAIDGVNELATSTAGLLTHVRAPLAKDVRDITGLVDTLNANAPTLTYVIQQLPPTVEGLIRTASYGSWFNFYLCSVSGTLTVGKQQIPIPNLAHVDEARCGG